MFDAIFAMSQNRVIGRAGKLPWRMPEDLVLFKKTTWGARVIMGRKTFDSLGRKILKERENIVFSSQPIYQEGVVSFQSSEELLKRLANKTEKKNFIIGGAQIFSLFLPLIQKIYLSYLPQNFEGDTYLPPFEKDFEKIEQKNIPANIPFFFQIWQRK